MRAQDTRNAPGPDLESIETVRRVSPGRGPTWWRWRNASPVLLATLALTLALMLSPGGTPSVGAAGDSEAGYLGAQYRTGDVIPYADFPTAGNSQSKLWFNDGTWWGLLYSPTAGGYRIHRLAIPAQTWIDTGVMVETRFYSHADVMWDGSHLYVAAGVLPGKGATDLNARLLRFSYSGGSYSLDAGFPVVLAQVEMQAIVLDKDSTGMLWATYTASNGQGGTNVYVTHTTGSDTAWRAPYVLPVTQASNRSSNDSSSVIAYDGKIGVMWTSQPDSTAYFASHQDGTPDNQWTAGPVVRFGLNPDIFWGQTNLKSLSGDPAGRVFAAVQFGGSPALLRLDGNGRWNYHSVPTNYGGDFPVSLGPSPVVAVDTDQRKLYMFSSDAWSGWVSNINYAETPLDRINFGYPTGFIWDNGCDCLFVEKPTTAKGNVNGTTGLVVLASTSYSYWHNSIGLTGPTPPTPTATSVPPTATAVPPTATPLPTWAPPPGDLLTNGSFENGSTGWLVSSVGSVSAEAAYEGSFGLRFSDRFSEAIARQDLAVPGGTPLTFRAAGRVVAQNNSTGAGIVEFKVYDEGGAQLGYWRMDTVSGAPSDWRVITGTVTTPGNSRRARVQVRVVNFDGIMDFDAFSLTAEGAPPPTAVPPTATAVPPTATSVPPTATGVPPTAVPPTATPVPPTATAVPPTATPGPTSPPASGELLTNGSFENGSTGWTLSANAQVSASAAYEGSYGLRFSGQTASAIARQDLAVTGGSTLNFRAAGRLVARNNTTEAGIVEFKVYDQGGVQLAYWRFDTIQGAPSDWRVMTGSVTLPLNTKKARLQVRVVNLNGTMDFDAFSLSGGVAPQIAAVEPVAAADSQTARAATAGDTSAQAAAEVAPAESATPATETAVPTSAAAPTVTPSEPSATAVPPTATAEPTSATETAAQATANEVAPEPTPKGRGAKPPKE